MTIAPLGLEYFSHGLLASDEDIINLIIFGIFIAISVIANIAKTRSARKKTSQQTGNDTVQEERTSSPQAQAQPKKTSRLEQILGTIATPESKSTEKDTRSRRRRYYTPGGFAEVLKQDRALEDTLTESYPKTKPRPQIEKTLESPFKPFDELGKIEIDDFHDIGSIEDALTEKSDDRTASASVVEALSVSLQRLPEAIIYSEILAKPVGMRENEDMF